MSLGHEFPDTTGLVEPVVACMLSPPRKPKNLGIDCARGGGRGQEGRTRSDSQDAAVAYAEVWNVCALSTVTAAMAEVVKCRHGVLAIRCVRDLHLGICLDSGAGLPW